MSKKFYKWLAIIGWLLAFIMLGLYFMPDLEANQEPDWSKLVSIVIQIESSGNPNAISKANCRGLMQISEITFKEFIDVERGFIGTRKEPDGSITNIFIYSSDILCLYDPKININIGTWYLKRIWFHYLPYYKLEQTIQNLCYAYNMGIGNLVKYRQGKIKLPKETRQYWLKYQKIAGGK